MSEQQQTMETEQNELTPEQEYARQFARFNQLAQEKNVHVPTCYRLLIHSYIKQGLIPDYEMDALLDDVAMTKDTPLNKKVVEVFSGLLGWFLMPFAVRKMENSLLALNVETDEQKFMNQYMLRLQQRMLEKI